MTATVYIGGVATVSTITNGANTSTAVRYLLKDHLGSTFFCASDSACAEPAGSADDFTRRPARGTRVAGCK
jgi:hypothetical protein